MWSDVIQFAEDLLMLYFEMGEIFFFSAEFIFETVDLPSELSNSQFGDGLLVILERYISK